MWLVDFTWGRIVTYMDPGSWGHRVLDKVLQFTRGMSPQVPVFKLVGSWWPCLERLWNVWEMGPCWRKWVTEGQALR